MKTFLKLLLFFGVAVVGGLTALSVQDWFYEKSPILTVENDDIDDFAREEKSAFSTSGTAAALPDFIAAADKTIHAVVHIRSEFRVRTRVYDDYFGLFDFSPFSRRYREQSIMGYGSGVIISEDGYIVTNNHVVQDAAQIEVTLDNRHSYIARLVGADPSSDLAVLKVEAQGLPFLSFANSDRVRIGEWVLAVGNPFNLTSTVTAGIVSAKARNINIISANLDDSPIESFIQTDAPINSGNSGGALVNARGELIGINAAIASNTGAYAGYSFAIPANIAKKVTSDLIQYGVVQRAYLGVTAEMGNRFGKEQPLERGVALGALLRNGAAHKAGVQVGDVLLSINGKEVNSRAEMMEIIGRNLPGDQIEITVLRDGKTHAYQLTLLNRENGEGVIRR
ncbi:MAG: trypsin-like peptidase domain-containing protein [Bacteroidales bacterium]|nr:trypsin-like peptidase domain-containing protein [Bacteroidales bacterium]